MSKWRATGLLILTVALFSCQPQEREADQSEKPSPETARADLEVPDKPVTWSCDGVVVIGDFSNEGLVLRRGDQNQKLQQALSGSGARYTNAGDTPSIVFWIKGNTASYEEEGENSLQCFVIDDPNNPESSALAGSWTAKQINDVDVAADTTVTLIISDDLQLSGNNGCNTYSGSIKISEDGIAVGPMATTMMACPEEIMEQEQHFSGILSRATSVKFNGADTVIFTDPGGQSITADRVN